MWSRLAEVQLGQTKCVINLHLSCSCLVSPTAQSASATTHIVTFSRSHKHSCVRCHKCTFTSERVWQLSLRVFKSTFNRSDTSSNLNEQPVIPKINFTVAVYQQQNTWLRNFGCEQTSVTCRLLRQWVKTADTSPDFLLCCCNDHYRHQRWTRKQLLSSHIWCPLKMH